MYTWADWMGRRMHCPEMFCRLHLVEIPGSQTGRLGPCEVEEVAEPIDGARGERSGGTSVDCPKGKGCVGRVGEVARRLGLLGFTPVRLTVLIVPAVL